MSDKTASFGRLVTVSLIVCGVLAGCAKKERILPGERLDLRAPNVAEGETAAETEEKEVRVDKLSLASPVANSEWTHRNGNAQHLIRHPALRRGLQHVWSANIGTGNSKKHAISASPIVAGGRVFTMDANSGVRAFTTAGAPIWENDLTPSIEKSNEASGGGLAYGAGILAVTTGHGEVLVLDPASGAVKWRHQMSGAISADPVVIGNVIVAVSRNNEALGLNVKNGRILWQQISPGGSAGVAGAGAPAAVGRLAVVPYASGEIVGAVTTNGLRAWSAAVTGTNKSLARSIVSDISGDPVIDGSVVYVANQSGRIAALDRRSGERAWSAKDGSYTPVWPAGGAVFMITDRFAVKRLNASDGTEVWSSPLPDFKQERDRRKRATYAYFGPVLAGGQLWVGGSDGLLRSYNPVDGSPIGTVEIPGGAASQPAIAGGKLFIMSQNGQLHAFQ